MSNSPDRRQRFSSNSANEPGSRFDRRSINYGVVGDGPSRKILGYGVSQLNELHEEEDNTVDTEQSKRPIRGEFSKSGSFMLGDFVSRQGTSLRRHSIAPRDDNTWTCEICTFLNTDTSSLTCEVCVSERKVKKEIADRRCSFQGGMSLYSSFNLSINGDLEEQISLFREFEEKAMKKVQMEEVMEYQRQIMLEISQNPDGRGGSEHGGWRVNFPGGSEELLRTKQTLEESRARVRFLESIHFTEKEDQDDMAAFLEQRKLEIEESEGKPIEECTGRTSRPGACHVSTAALEWMAQNRLLDDWRVQWKECDDEIQALIAQEQLIVDKWKNEYNISL